MKNNVKKKYIIYLGVKITCHRLIPVIFYKNNEKN